LTIKFVRINAANATLLNNVADDVFDEPIIPVRVAAYLANPSNLMILAIHDGIAIGMVMAVVHQHPDKPNDLFIDEVGVTPAFRRQGIARLLMEAIVTWGQERACEEAWLGTEIDNVAARALYRRFAKGQEIILYEWDLED